MIQPNIRFLLAAILLGVSACKKSAHEPGCTPIPPYQGDTGFYISIEDSAQYNAPCFDPNSDEEYVYVHKTGREQHLAIGSIVTRNARWIGDGEYRSGPKWSQKGWIVFQSERNNVPGVSIIRPDGSGLTEVTRPDMGFFKPCWNFDATAIIASPPLNSPLLLSMSGLIFDTLQMFPREDACAFLDSTTIVSRRFLSAENATIGGYDVSTGVYQPVSAIRSRSLLHAAVISESEFIWSDESGIYLSNRKTLKTKMLRETCDAVLYTSPSVNRSRSKILWSKKTTAVSADRLTLFIRTELVTTDLRGGNEENVTPVVN